MNKQKQKNLQGPRVPSVSFIEFWRFIAKSLGDSRLRIRNQAVSIESFLAPNSDHREFLRDVIITSYFESDCCGLDDAVNMNVVLDAMGEAAYELQGRNKDDLLDIELLEEIAYLMQQKYNYLIDIQMPSEGFASSSEVISFVDSKIRRANTQF